MKGELCIKSGYTFLSSTLKIEDIIDIAKKNKYDYLGLIDKDVMFGCMEFYNQCIKNNVKPIIGVEFDLSNETLVCLIAKDNEGYKGLVKLSSYVNVKKEKLSLESIKEYKDHLIVVLPGYRGLHKISKDEYTLLLDYYKETFPHFYLGMEYYQNKELYKTNSYIRELDYKKVCFNNIVSENKEDLDNIEVLKAIKENNVIGYIRNKENLTYSSFLSDDEKRNNFKYEELIMCEEIVNLVDIKFEKQQMKICKFNQKDGFDSTSYLRQLAYKGLEKRNKDFIKDSRYTKRLEKELNVINKMGFSDYFLIVYDYVKFAKLNNI